MAYGFGAAEVTKVNREEMTNMRLKKGLVRHDAGEEHLVVPTGTESGFSGVIRNNA